MAINKNFVVKNGLEVNTNSLTVDASTGYVGVGTSIGTLADLDVRGGIAATNFYAVGIGTIITFESTTGTITDLTATKATIGVGTFDAVDTTHLNASGVSTLTSLTSPSATITYADITTLEGTRLNYSGLSTITTFDSNTSTIVSAQVTNLNATGVSTIASLSVTGSTFDTLTVNNFSNLAGVTTIDNAGVVNLSVSGISTLGTLQVASGIVTATTGVITYYGDGSQLDHIQSGIGIGTTGGLVGYGATFINFYGTGVSTAHFSETTGIATIFFEGGGSGTIGLGTVFPAANSSGDLFFHADHGRLFVYYDETQVGVGTDKYWIDAAPFNAGIITSVNNSQVTLQDGTATDPPLSFHDDQQTGVFSPANGQITLVSTGSPVLNVNASGANITGVVTATSFVGSRVDVAGHVEADSFNVSGITTFNNKTRLLDDIELHFGTNGVSGDFKTYVDSANAHSVLYEDIIGQECILQSNIGGESSNAFEFRKSSSTMMMMRQQSVLLYAGGNLKFETNDAGINVTGHSELDNVNVSGVSTFSGNVQVGTALTLSSASVDGGATVNILGNNINLAGVATAQDFDALSDANFKDNIETVENALDKVDNLRGVRFEWKRSGAPAYGVIAQELEEVLPELVHGGVGADPKTVNYNGIIGVLIEAIKELKEEVNQLKNK
jgi:hypothetical protein